MSLRDTLRAPVGLRLHQAPLGFLVRKTPFELKF